MVSFRCFRLSMMLVGGVRPYILMFRQKIGWSLLESMSVNLFTGRKQQEKRRTGQICTHRSPAPIKSMQAFLNILQKATLEVLTLKYVRCCRCPPHRRRQAQIPLVSATPNNPSDVRENVPLGTSRRTTTTRGHTSSLHMASGEL